MKKQLLLDKEGVILYITDDYKETSEEFKVNNIIIPKEEGMKFVEVDNLSPKVTILNYIYKNGKIKKKDTFLSRLKGKVVK